MDESHLEAVHNKSAGLFRRERRAIACLEVRSVIPDDGQQIVGVKSARRGKAQMQQIKIEGDSQPVITRAAAGSGITELYFRWRNMVVGQRSRMVVSERRRLIVMVMPFTLSPQTLAEISPEQPSQGAVIIYWPSRLVSVIVSHELGDRWRKPKNG